MIVFAGRTSLQVGGTRAGRRIEFEDTDVATWPPILPPANTSCPNWRPAARIHSNYNSAQTVTGSYPPFADIRSIPVAEGRFYDWQDVRRAAASRSWAARSRSSFFPRGGAIGQNIYLNDIPYKVIGVMRRKKQDSSYDGWDINKIYVPYSVMHQDFPNKPPPRPTAWINCW